MVAAGDVRSEMSTENAVDRAVAAPAELEAPPTARTAPARWTSAPAESMNSE